MSTPAHIYNLSHKHLTQPHLELLNLGLQFTPSPDPKADTHINQFWPDYLNTCRKKYPRITTGSTKPHLVRNKYGFLQKKLAKSTIPSCCPAPVEDLLECQERHLLSLIPRKYQRNLSYHQHLALKDLMHDNTITIKPADKGSGITILDTAQYVAEGFEHLKDPTTYEQITADYSKNLTIAINKFLARSRTKKIITQLTHQALHCDPDNTRTQKIYFLRKVHKTPHGLRPIVSGVQGPTETISAFIDTLLRKHIPNCHHVVENSTQMINKIENTTFSSSCLLCTLDVKSLYMRIPQEEGIQTVLDRIYSSTSPPKYPRPFVHQLLKFILTDNIFSFSNHMFRQKLGVAMGTRCAPNFANIFMAALEENLLASRTSQNLPVPSIWLRYIDDIILIWEHDRRSLNTFIQQLNTLHPTIKFTADINNTSLPYLDIKLHKGSRFRTTGILDIAPYSKPCHTHTYLHYSSCHPRHTFKGIVIGEAKRTIRNSSDLQTYNTHISDLITHFIHRGYPRKFLKKTLANITYSSRTQLLTYVKPKTHLTRPDRTMLKIPFHPGIKTSIIHSTLRTENLPFNPSIISIPRPTLSRRLVRAAPPTN